MDVRERQLAWLRHVLVTEGLSATGLAKKARIAQTTLTNFLKPNWPGNLNAHSVDSVERATGIPFRDVPDDRGFSEGEASKYDATPKADPVASAIRHLIGERNGVDPWRLKGRGLEAAGYLPGDIVIVDLNAEPKFGDVVCAQAYKWGGLGADTIFRVYERGVLVAKTLDPAIPALTPIDDHNVQIRGVVIASLRERQARRAA